MHVDICPSQVNRMRKDPGALRTTATVYGGFGKWLYCNIVLAKLDITESEFSKSSSVVNSETTVVYGMDNGY